MALTSILLCTIDRYDLTVQCVGSALAEASKNFGTSFELLHVDNGSVDKRVPEYIAEFNPVYQRLNTDNQGYAPMLNQMLLRAAGDYLCVIDNDILLPPNWLEEMIHANLRIADSGVSSYHCVQDLPAPEYFNGVEVHFRESVFGVKFYSRAVIEKIGYYLDEYSPYGNEDVDFNLRCHMAGLKNYYIGGGLRAKHLGDDCASQSPYRQMKWASLKQASLVLDRQSAYYRDTGNLYIAPPAIR